MELRVEIPAPGKNERKAINGTEGGRPLHPVRLKLFSSQKLQFMIGTAPLPAELYCVILYDGVLPRETITFQPLQYLLGLQEGILPVPLFDQALIWPDQKVFLGSGQSRAGKAAIDLLPRYAEVFGYLPRGQPLHFVKMSYLTAGFIVHNGLEFTGKTLPNPSSLLSWSIGRKRRIINPPQAYLVFYHVFFVPRYQQNPLLVRL